jgi:hypothetical protein
MSFGRAKEKISIASLDITTLHVTAQYNPKELQVDQAVQWKKQDGTNKTSVKEEDKKIDNSMALEFTGAEGRTMTVELLFDGYEPTDVGQAYDKGQGTTYVIKCVSDLTTMAQIIDPTATKEAQRRPHHCVVSWGAKGLPRFSCVIESLSTKYTMFSSDGAPLRATCTVKLKEALTVDKIKDADKPNGSSAPSKK